ncbi:MAG: VOC family protein [Acidobacteriota bacterium]
MTSKVKPVPEDYPTVTPYLTVKDAASAMEFYKNVFGAKESMRLAEPDGRIGHAEMQIGNSQIMISDEYPEIDVLGPQSRGGSTVGLHLYVEDVDAVFDKAVAAGAKVVRPVSDQFYGDRSGKLADPFGHVWFVSTRKENVSAEQVEERYQELKSS